MRWGSWLREAARIVARTGAHVRMRAYNPTRLRGAWFHATSLPGPRQCAATALGQYLLICTPAARWCCASAARLCCTATGVVPIRGAPCWGAPLHHCRHVLRCEPTFQGLVLPGIAHACLPKVCLHFLMHAASLHGIQVHTLYAMLQPKLYPRMRSRPCSPRDRQRPLSAASADDMPVSLCGLACVV